MNNYYAYGITYHLLISNKAQSETVMGVNSKGRTPHSNEANPCDAMEPTENILVLEEIIKAIGHQT